MKALKIVGGWLVFIPVICGLLIMAIPFAIIYLSEKAFKKLQNIMRGTDEMP